MHGLAWGKYWKKFNGYRQAFLTTRHMPLVVRAHSDSTSESPKRNDRNTKGLKVRLSPPVLALTVNLFKAAFQLDVDRRRSTNVCRENVI